MAESLDVKRKQKKNNEFNDYVLKKRNPPKNSSTENDIYVSKKQDFKAQLGICKNKLSSLNSEITIHALGTAITRAINLALQLKEIYSPTCEIDVNTSTVTLVDDLEPLTDEGDYDTRTRQSSAIHIRVYRTIPSS